MLSSMFVGSIAGTTGAAICADNPNWRESNTNSGCSAYATGGQYHAFCSLDTSVDGVSASEGCTRSCCARSCCKQVGANTAGSSHIRISHKNSKPFVEDAGEKTHSLYHHTTSSNTEPGWQSRLDSTFHRFQKAGLLATIQPSRTPTAFTEDSGEQLDPLPTPASWYNEEIHMPKKRQSFRTDRFKYSIALANLVRYSIAGCNANYGSKLGDKLCCLQQGHIRYKETICPDHTKPFCVGFDGGENFGKPNGRCAMKTTLSPTTQPVFVLQSPSQVPTISPSKAPTRGADIAMDKLVKQCMSYKSYKGTQGSYGLYDLYIYHAGLNAVVDLAA